MAFKMKGPSLYMKGKSPLPQATGVDPEYLQQLEEIAKNQGITVEQAHKRYQRRQTEKDISNLSRRELRKRVKEEKKDQDIAVPGNRKTYRKKEGGAFGPEIKRPGIFSSRAHKEDYIKAMENRKLSDFEVKKAASREEADRYLDSLEQ